MKDFTKILVAALIVALVPHPGDAAVPKCPADGEACFDCTTKGNCSAGADTEALPGDLCPAGEACKVVSGVTTCMPVAEVPACGCGGGRQGCDAYNADQQIFCIPAGAGTNIFTGSECDSAINETCLEGQCVPKEQAAGTCAGKTTTGFYPVAPTCTSGAFCLNEEEQYTVTCSAGQYFNKAKAACEAFPPNPCTDCTKQKCPIISDCTKYAICSNGQVVDGDESCATGYFDPDEEDCETAFPEVCEYYKDCEFESTATGANTTSSENITTPTSTTTTLIKLDPCAAANVNQRYPHETDCKKYYTCRLNRGNTYSYVTSSCPGSYVFNPSNSFCDEASNVPDCEVAK